MFKQSRLALHPVILVICDPVTEAQFSDVESDGRISIKMGRVAFRKTRRQQEARDLPVCLLPLH